MNCSLFLKRGYQTWKLDGLFTPGTAFVSIVACFAQAKQLLTEGTWTAEQAASLSEQVRQLHPAQRGLDTGFLCDQSRGYQVRSNGNDSQTKN